MDPVTPSRITLVLPPEACKGLRDSLWRGYREAWSIIVERLREYLDGFYRFVDKVLSDELLRQVTRERMGRNLAALIVLARSWDSVKGGLKELEPLLPLRVAIVNVGDEYKNYHGSFLHSVRSRAIKLIDNRKELGGEDKNILKNAVKRVSDELFYHYLMRVAMPCIESLASGFKLSRRSGTGYARYAQRV